MKKILSLVLTTALLASMCLALTACGDNGSGDTTDTGETPTNQTEQTDTTTTTEPPEGIQAGTSITMRVDRTTSTQLPYNDFGTELTNKQMYDTLFYAVNGDYSNIENLLAKECVISEDGLTATLTIQEGVKFSNGDTLDANAIVAAFDIAKSGAGASMYFQNVAGYEATDDYTLVMTFLGPYANFKNDFAQSFTSIFNAKVVQELGETDPNAAIGSGPYIVESFVNGDSLVFKANPDYWFAERMPHIETVTLKIIPDENTALIALQSGEIQSMSTTNVAIFNTAQTVDEVAPVKVVADSFIMWYNEDNALLADAKVREALTYLVNVEEINAGAFDGNGTPVYGGPWTNDESLSATTTDGYTYNEEKGLALLAEAGVDPASITLKTLDWAGTTALNTVVQAQLKKVGITLDFTSASSPGDIMPDIQSGNWDIIINSGAFTLSNPISAFTNLIAPNPMLQVVRFNTADPAVHQQLQDGVNSALTALTIEDQFAELKGVNQILADNYAYMFAIQSPQWHLYDSTKIANYVVDGSAPYWLLHYAYVIE